MASTEAGQYAAPPRPSWPPKSPTQLDQAKGWPLRHWILALGAVMIVFAIVAVGLGSLALIRISDARSVVLNEIYPALRASKDLSNALVSQENGVRGYGVTGREEFLAPYRFGLRTEQQAVNELRRLATGPHVGSLIDDIDAVQMKAQAWRAHFAEPAIAAILAGQRLDVAVDLSLDKARFDAVTDALITLGSGLDKAFADATARLHAAADFLLAVFVSIAMGLVVMVIAVGTWLRLAVTVPLSRLAGEVRLVVSGDAHREVHARGPREVVELADDIDAMRRHILAELDALESAHRRLDEQARDLERSNRDLEQFAYVASHDLQEPLRKVSSFCQLLQRRYGGQLDERADTYIAFAVDGASRMQRLINDLLAFSRVGRVTTGMGAVDLNAVAEAALGQLTAAREETDARITVGDLPTVTGEASLLTQLMANLVSNALKFRRPDIRPEVTIGARPHEDGWEIFVADNGIGIEPEYADRIFVIFQRLHPRQDYPGTGIGLAMAKRIVEYHGGRIWLDPDRTHGATIRFTLRADPTASER
jgi:signal transduction histidine kinase